MPTGRRGQAGYLVETDGTSVLVDCGSGVLHALATVAAGYRGIDAVLLTHLHLDHVADLLPLLKARWLADAGPLAVYGPPGTEALLEDLIAAFGYLGGKLEYAVSEVEPPAAEVAGLDIGIHETEHSIRCFAYRFAGPDGDLTFSGDTEAAEHVASFASGSAVLVHDCSFPDGVEADNHARPSELGDVLADVELGRVVLTHLYPHAADRTDELCRAVGASVDAPVDVLPDGTTLVVQ